MRLNTILFTRFNDTICWRPRMDNPQNIAEMDTGHLINILKMFQEKPMRTMSMLIDDIENSIIFEYGRNPVEKTLSIKNITSMTEADLVEFALSSELGVAIQNELVSRGVNIDNVLKISNGNSFDTFEMRCNDEKTN